MLLPHVTEGAQVDVGALGAVPSDAGDTGVRMVVAGLAADARVRDTCIRNRISKFCLSSFEVRGSNSLIKDCRTTDPFSGNTFYSI